MKIFLSIFCWILAIYSIYFPFSYFHKIDDIKEVKVSHILVETQEQAADIKKQLEDGANFEELAKNHSLCPSKSTEGNLGYTIRGQVVPEIEEVIFKLPKLTISEPVQSKAGWHILKVYDVRYFSDKENFAYKYDIDRLIKTMKS